MTQDTQIASTEAKGSADAKGSLRAPDAVDTLRDAMRRARQDNAERAGVMADLRSARLGRLELLAEALKPLFAQIPEDVDIFEVGLMPGANPRLFVDMIGFVEMGRDARVYRLLQDTRHGRTKLAESENVDAMVDAVTDYVARRLLERDKALAADTRTRTARLPRVEATAGAEPSSAGVPLPASADRPGRSVWRLVAGAINFFINFLGWLTFFAIVAGVAWYVWQRTHGSV